MSRYHTMLSAAVDRHNGGDNMEQFLRSIMSAESSGDRHARNTESSATGLFQFTRGTWSRYGRGGDIYDPAAQCDAVVRLALDNGRDLRNALDREPTAGEYYLAHFAGSSGARRVLAADGDTPISQILSADALHSNRRITFNGKRFRDFTADDLEAWAAHKMGERGERLNARDRYNDWSTFESGIEGDTQQDEFNRRRGFLTSIGMDEASVNALCQSPNILTDFFFALISAVLGDVVPSRDREPSVGDPVSPTLVAGTTPPNPTPTRTA